ncbi:uncharacterized protein LOC143366843 [Andrena cerasifolii]|uniref:uncharacterized protein LOC143366843 n=1 Tax=Andrena cerasifolii TaxID=2819439 RepID=UPI004037C3E3
MQLKLLLSLYFFTNITFNFAFGISLLKKYDKLHKKLNRMLNRQKESELLLDINEIEYPRANETLRNIHKQLWEEYYQCLKRTYIEIGSEKAIYPIALAALEGTFVTLKCEICISPLEAYTSDNIEWHFNSSANNGTESIIEESDNVLISPEDKGLMIYNIKPEQAGQYWCKLEDTLSTVFYYISIDTDVQGVTVVYPLTAPNKPHAIPDKVIPEYNLIVHTTWSKWSLCSTCNVVGKKVRYGYCTLSLDKNVISQNIETTEEQHLQDNKRQVEDEATNGEESETIESTTRDGQTEIMDATSENKGLGESVINKIRTSLNVFRNKLACNSKYVPKEILELPDIKSRKTEIMTRYCKIKCTGNEIFEVRNKQGQVLESANNSAGIYAMVQGMPIPEPPVIRTVIYQKFKKKATLMCPGNLNTRVPVTWKLDNKVLNPSVINEQSAGRIRINPQMHIVITSLKFEDTNIYSCWQKNEIAGVLKLIVTGEIELQANYTVIMVGGSLIIIVFLIVFWKAFEGRRRFTIH